MYNNYIAVDSEVTTSLILSSEKDVSDAVRTGWTIYACGEELLDGNKKLMYSPETGWVTNERPKFQTINSLRLTDSVESDIQYLSMMTGVDLYPEMAVSRSRMKARITKSKNFELVKNFYEKSLWSPARVYNAIGLWITEEEYSEIIGGD